MSKDANEMISMTLTVEPKMESTRRLEMVVTRSRSPSPSRELSMEDVVELSPRLRMSMTPFTTTECGGSDGHHSCSPSPTSVLTPSSTSITPTSVLTPSTTSMSHIIDTYSDEIDSFNKIIRYLHAEYFNQRCAYVNNIATVGNRNGIDFTFRRDSVTSDVIIDSVAIGDQAVFNGRYRQYITVISNGMYHHVTYGINDDAVMKVIGAIDDNAANVKRSIMMMNGGDLFTMFPPCVSWAFIKYVDGCERGCERSPSTYLVITIDDVIKFMRKRFGSD